MLLGLKEITVILVSLFFIACAGTQTIPEPESPGAKLYKEKCTKCHGLPGVTRHTPHQWDYLLVMMEGFMQEKGISFPEQEKQLIQDYLHRHAR
jgi:hypothetical protein